MLTLASLILLRYFIDSIINGSHLSLSAFSNLGFFIKDSRGLGSSISHSLIEIMEWKLYILSALTQFTLKSGKNSFFLSISFYFSYPSSFSLYLSISTAIPIKVSIISSF